MADIKHRNNKWVLVSDEKDSSGRPKKEEEYETKEEAEKALQRWEGHKYHNEGKKPVRGNLSIIAKINDKYDVKKKENGKWTVVDEKGHIYHNAGEFDTEKEAVERLREMAGWAAHKDEPKGYYHKKSELLKDLVILADYLDEKGAKDIADKIDEITKKIVG